MSKPLKSKTFQQSKTLKKKSTTFLGLLFSLSFASNLTLLSLTVSTLQPKQQLIELLKNPQKAL